MERLYQWFSGRTFAATCLVAGTCIGGGMLALPLSSGTSGFFPSLVIMLICWFMMTFTALLLLEVSLWMEPDVHVITMSSRILGWPGRAVSWVLYLFISYASLVAYTAEGGSQLAHLFERFDLHLSLQWSSLLYIVGFALIIDLGSALLGRINTIFFVAMMLAYMMLIGSGVSEVHLDNLTHTHWAVSWMAVPVILTTFSFQTMVPSLPAYMNRNIGGLRTAIIGGTTLTLLVYVLWQWLILGIVPLEGDHGLHAAWRDGIQPTRFLE